MNDLLGLLETGATLGTGAVSGLLGMPYGLYKGITSGAYGTPLANRIAEEEARKFMERNTYQPRTQAAQENLQAIAGLLERSKLPPVMPEVALLGQIPRQAVAAQAERAGMAAEKAIEPAVRRTMERGGLPAQLLQDLSQGSISPMDVWHGSPHGPFTSFDRTKIGSGEGAQAYGYGHYTAEARGTGEEYRRMLSTKVDVDGKPLYDANKIVGSTGNADLDDYLVANLGDVKAARQNIIEDIKFVAEGNPEAAKDMQKTLDALDNLKVDKKESGYLYKIDLPDEAIAKMLDYDKPIKDQPEALKAIRNQIQDADIEKSFDANVKAGISGANAMTNYVWGKTPAEKSEAMRQAGITGIRYLDQGSRGASEGTSNFVVFPGNENLLTIKEINDKPIGGLLAESAPFKVTSQDASEIFGEGAKRIRYQEPNSQGFIDVLQKPDGTASVLGLEVPETARGKGIGQSLQAQVLSDFPEMQGQVSSKAAATTAYRLGRRPVGMPDASLDDVFKMIDENSSVNLVSPDMQKRFRGSLLD